MNDRLASDRTCIHHRVEIDDIPRDGAVNRFVRPSTERPLREPSSEITYGFTSPATPKRLGHRFA
jgi:hypothetical protein